MLIHKSYRCNTPIICAMGTGNKLDPFQFKIDAIEKTNTCPLAKAVRKELKALDIKGIPVLFSEEEVFLPELLLAADIVTEVMNNLSEKFMSSEASIQKRGTVLLATVEGDVHDIG
ncbi:MAG: hypothetical protein EOM23_10150, partial [Candidatus Moranbacteria bacterium]|nr:hypothetical protein [Candidatus Moranbacteria bacterium]